MNKNRFCFKISPDAGLANDGEGNNSHAYLEVKFDTSEPLNGDEYNQAHVELITALSKQLDINPEYIKKITTKDYDENH